jgi:hypothetical protein
MNRIIFVLLAVFVLCACSVGCTGQEGQGKKFVVEEVTAPKPNLPTVPTIQKPNVPETYPDGSYSAYGLRKNIRKTMETKVTITAYIAELYQKPECEKGKRCHTLMPHLFLADEQEEKLERRRLRLVGYAQSFKDMEDEEKASKRGKKKEPLPEGVYLPPIVWDWELGKKYKISGLFTRQSGAGFMATDGLLEYESHECLDCPTDDEETKE